MTPPEADAGQAAAERSRLIKLGIDLAPLVLFFATYMTAGIYWATGVLMVTSVVSMIVSYRLLGEISPSLVLTTVLVVGFGSLTLWLNDPRFIKMKPTMIYLLFTAMLLGGLALGKPTLKLLLGEVFKLTPAGWSGLSIRWAVFFVALAILNEVIWRNFSEATWVSLKTFGFLPLTIVFFASQLKFINRHTLPEVDGKR